MYRRKRDLDLTIVKYDLFMAYNVLGAILVGQPDMKQWSYLFSLGNINRDLNKNSPIAIIINCLTH